MEDIKLLKKLDIFKDLSSFELARIGKLIKSRIFEEGEQVVTMGEEGESLFIVKSGEAKVSRTIDNEKEEILAVLSVGDHFGEVALIDLHPRSADVYANNALQLLQIKKSDLEKLLTRDKDLAIKIYKTYATTLCKRLRDSNEHLLTIKNQ